MRNNSARARKLQNLKVVAHPHGLTYNASIHSACLESGLEQYQLKLYNTQKAWRYVYFSKGFLNWFNSELPNLAVPTEGNDDLYVQLETEFLGFCSGEPLSDLMDIKCLDPHDYGVWELKTANLRIFGWFPEKNYFIVHHVELKGNLTKYANYTAHINAVVKFRESLASVLSSYVSGKGVFHVISNKPRSF